MEFSSILWGVAFLVTPAVLAWGMLLHADRQTKLAVLLFGIAPLPIIFMEIMYAATTSDSLAKRLTVAGIIGAISVIATVEQIRVALKRRAKS